MRKIAVIGGGISGLTVAKKMNGKYRVTVFERNSTHGGLIRCRRVGNSLFHTCGGHVFNSKRQDVLDWFWTQFHRDEDFSKADRNSVVFMNGGEKIPYPIENHMYFFNAEIQKRFIDDLVAIAKKQQNVEPRNFEEFLKGRFGETLYDMYFQPYNEKVWRRDLSMVPLSWLEGKLPMPTVEEMIYNNINHVKEKAFVHSTFWYEKINGSQFLADRLAEGLDIRYNVDITDITYKNGQWTVEDEQFDKIVFCGNIKDMVKIIHGVDVEVYKRPVEKLEYHGTTAVFCEIDANPYSWIYLPSRSHESHRIICTGNFSPTNNADKIPDGRITATVEFTDEISKEDIISNLCHIPLHPIYIDHEYNKYTYPIQNSDTRDIIKKLKQSLVPYSFYFTGRFADWEYYNMDVAMGAALDLCKTIE